MTASDNVIRCHPSILNILDCRIASRQNHWAVVTGSRQITGRHSMQIEIHDLTKVYKEKRGLLPVNIEVEKGELVAVIGHNGAGKSTLLKMLANWLLPDSGQVSVDGINLGNRLAVVRKFGFVPETPNLFDQFSVEYNLRI